jgi:hypothetical protein
MNPVRRHVVAILFLGLFIAARPASADSILTVSSFASSDPFAPINVTPFDPALGTLDSVNVGITGTLVVSGVNTAFFAGTVPIPYDYQFLVHQSFDGFADTFFDFNGDATFFLPNHASGLGESFSIATNFSYTFTANATTDLTGFIFPSTSSTIGALQPPLSGISGQRADFYETSFPIHEIDLSQNAFVQFNPVPVVISDVFSAGSMTIQYNYSPTPPPTTTPVPEPGTLVLFGSALACGLAGRRRT